MAGVLHICLVVHTKENNMNDLKDVMWLSIYLCAFSGLTLLATIAMVWVPFGW
jgi:hypothetical protein